MNNHNAESDAAANAAADAAASEAAFNFLSSSMNNPPFTVNPNNTQGDPSNLGPLSEGSMLASDPNSNLAADPQANMNAFSGQNNASNSLLMPSWQPQQQSNDPNGFMNGTTSSSSLPNGMWGTQATNDGGFGSPESASNNLQQQSGSVDPSYLSSMYNMPGFALGVAPDSTPAARNPSSMSSESDQATPLQRHISMASTAPTSNQSRGEAGLSTSLDQSSPHIGTGATAAFGSAAAANAAHPFTFSANPETGRAGPSPVFGQSPFPPFTQPPPHLARQWNSVDGRPFPPYPVPRGMPMPFNPSSVDPPRPPFLYGRSPMFPQGMPSPNTTDMAMAAVMGQTWPPKGDPNMFNKPGMGDIAEYPTGPAMWIPPGPGGADGTPSTSPSQMGPTGSSPSKPNYRMTPSGGVVKGATFLSRNILPPTALGGHAASHPPGLGNRVLRAGSGFGSGISMAGVPRPHRPSGPQGSTPSNQGMGYGGTNASASATDFTKRKGWPMRVVDELIDFVHVLDPKGNILFASPSIGDLTGWKPEELRGKNLAEMVHPDDATAVRERLDPTIQVPGADVIMYIRFRCKPDRTSTKKGARASDTVGESSAMGGDSSSTGSSRMGASSSASGVPEAPKRKKTKSTAPTVPGRVVANNVSYVVFEFTGHPYFPPADLAELVKERKAKLASKEDKKKGSALVGTTDAEPKPDDTPSLTVEQDESMDDLPALPADGGLELQCFFCSCRVHPTPNISVLDSFLELKVENERLRLVLQKLNMEDGQAAASAAAASSSTATPEPFPPSSRTSNNLTSKPMHPGHRSSSSISASTKPMSDPEDDPHKKNKKAKTEEGDYVCADCGRVDSPEWRKGPLGPKTLCNACGLRWAKRIKRKGGDPNAAALEFHQQASAAAQHPFIHSGPPPPPFMMGPQPG